MLLQQYLDLNPRPAESALHVEILGHRAPKSASCTCRRSFSDLLFELTLC